MQHLAMIMDGNRRWARSKKLEAVTMGHRKGVDSIHTAIEFCLKNEIKYLSLYAFSLENFRRIRTEKEYIFKLLVEMVEKKLPDFLKQGIRISFLGDRGMFPKITKKAIELVERETKYLNKLTVSILFCYGGRQELVAATKKIAEKVRNGAIRLDDINEDVLRQSLWKTNLPDPDLIIRTGGQSRLSNFFTFQSAYSELMFVDFYWPELTEAHLQQCMDNYSYIQKNLGR